MSIQPLKDAYKVRKELHHACLIKGGADYMSQLVSFLEEDLGFATKDNPDFHHYEHDSFGIDDGRNIKNISNQKAYGDRKIFVVTFNTMTREAQNALLKLFEEPTASTHFFLITPNTEKLLSTLRSRLFIVAETFDILGDDLVSDAKTFLKLTKSKRLDYMKDIIESKDKMRAASFLNAVESLLYEELNKNNKNKDAITFSLNELGKTRQYLFDRASSLKLLLEHMTLVVPQI